MTEEQKQKYRAALKKVDLLGARCMEHDLPPELDAVYLYAVGLQVVIESLLEDL